MRRLWMTGLLVCGLPVWAAEWQVEDESSRLGFHTNQQDGRLDGEFREWDATIHFDPTNLQDAVIDVSIDIGSITTGSRQRDVYLPDEEWFFTERFPTATFRATEVEGLGESRYVAHGELTLRGVAAAVDLPFTWTSDGSSAQVHAETTLERTRFGVGSGEFADSDVVGLNVQVVADLTLRRKP